LSRERESMSEMKMVVGLGNPGEEYAKTRHNAGFWVIDSLGEVLKRDKDTDVSKLGTLADVRREKFGGLVGEGESGNKKLIFLKPMEFMNNSGQAVATAVGFYKLAPSDLLVISDDLALDPGVIRLRAKGSSGGHNGLADIIEKLGTEQFARLRIGIGKNEFEPAEAYVLKRPSDQQKAQLDAGVKKACEAAIWWIKNGIESAMNRFNEKIETEK
jgi:PTH1 family peptidyl-tRNA hydrolase